MNEKRIRLAQQFAREAHDSIGQQRKYTHDPYWVHTDRVAETVRSVGGTENMIVAAHLHDVEEDVAPHNKLIQFPEHYGLHVDSQLSYGITAITLIFGELVADWVLHLTDVFTREKYPDWNRDKRKRAEAQRFERAPIEVKTIKLADLFDNTDSIVAHDKGFAKTYLQEKLNLLPYLSDGNSALLNAVSVQTLIACDKVGIKIPIIAAPKS